jgi:hypothetical protein
MARISVKQVAEQVRAFAKELSTYRPEDLADEEGNVGGDVRLQVVDGDWMIHTGDAQYDQDHRGRWGAGWVPAGAGARECLRIAAGLIAEAAGW